MSAPVDTGLLAAALAMNDSDNEGAGQPQRVQTDAQRKASAAIASAIAVSGSVEADMVPQVCVCVASCVWASPRCWVTDGCMRAAGVGRQGSRSAPPSSSCCVGLATSCISVGGPLRARLRAYAVSPTPRRSGTLASSACPGRVGCVSPPPPPDTRARTRAQVQTQQVVTASDTELVTPGRLDASVPRGGTERPAPRAAVNQAAARGAPGQCERENKPGKLHRSGQQKAAAVRAEAAPANPSGQPSAGGAAVTLVDDELAAATDFTSAEQALSGGSNGAKKRKQGTSTASGPSTKRAANASKAKETTSEPPVAVMTPTPGDGGHGAVAEPMTTLASQQARVLPAIEQPEATGAAADGRGKPGVKLPNPNDKEYKAQMRAFKEQHLLRLKQYVAEAGTLKDGWEIQVSRRANSSRQCDIYFISPEGEKFRSKDEVRLDPM